MIAPWRVTPSGGEGRSASQQFALIAKVLLKAGFLNDADRGDINELVMCGFDRVNQSVLGQAQHLSDLSLNFEYDTGDDDMRWLSSRDEREPTFVIRLDVDTPAENCFIGPGLQSLAALHPGLDRLCMEVLERAGCFVKLWTPSTIHEVMTMTCWFGMADHDDWLGEMVSMYGDSDEFDPADFFGPGDFINSYAGNAWVLSTVPSAAESARRLRSLARSDNAQVSHVAQLLRRLHILSRSRSPQRCDVGEEYEQDSAYAIAFPRISEDDPAMRAIDDALESMNQNSDYYTTTVLGWRVLPDERAIKQWLTAYRRTLMVFKALDEVLSLLTKGVTHGFQRPTTHP